MLRLSACGSRRPPESFPLAPGGSSSHFDDRDDNRAVRLTAAQNVSAAGAPPASACRGPDGRAPSRGVSRAFRRLRLPIMRRADGGSTSAPIRGTGTGGPAGAAGPHARSVRCAAAGWLLGFAALLALPLQAQAQAQTVTTLVSNAGQSESSVSSSDFQAQSCCSASPFDPPESKRINVLPRRSASNLRA